jgi:GntR family transcriptional regulator
MSNRTKIDDVVNEIKERIEKNIYVSGQRLPAEREFVEEFEVSRPTVRGAFRQLQEENLIQISPRSGAFVRSKATKITVGSPPVKNLKLKSSGSSIRTMQSAGEDTTVRMLHPSVVQKVGEEIGEKLQTDKNTEVLRRYRVQLINNVPYRILDSYYLADLLADFVKYDDEHCPLYKWMKDNTGYYPDDAYEKLNFRTPTKEEALLLNIGRGQGVVDMERWIWGIHPLKPNEELLFEYTRITANAALHEFGYSYKMNEKASKQ